MLHLSGQIILALIGLLALLCLASYYFVRDNEQAQERSLRKSLAQTEFKSEQIVEDITEFYNLLERVHPEPYAYITKTEFLKRVLELKKAAPSFATRLEFYKQLAPLVTEIGDEATQVLLPQGELDYHYSIQGRFFPFNVAILDGRGYIAHNYSNEPGISLGSEIISINDVNFSVMAQRLSQLFSGNSPEQQMDALAGQFRELLYLYYGMVEEYKLTIKQDGQLRNYLIEGKPFKKDKNPPYSFEQIDAATAYLRIGTTDADKRYLRFLRKTFSHLRYNDTRHLIIDLRNNHSNTLVWSNALLEYLFNTRFTQVKQMALKSSPEIKARYLHETPSWIRWLPANRLHPVLKRLAKIRDGEEWIHTPAMILPNQDKLHFPGKLTVLVGPGTMATARLAAATLKQKLNARWVGSLPPLDYQPFDNSIVYHLSNTGCAIILPTAVMQPIDGMPKQPDLKVVQSVDDLRHNRDTVLLAAMSLH